MSISNIRFYTLGFIVYMKLWLMDMIDYYFAYLILSLPTYVFGPPIIRVRQLLPDDSKDDDSSDDDCLIQMISYDIFISQLIFIFETNEMPPTMTHRFMHGAQLAPLTDQHGRFFLPRLGQYYPQLDTIIIKYAKTPVNNVSGMESQMLEKVLDVKKRFDIRNGKSCKMGVIF